MTEATSFGELNFGNARLGDRRRTKRLVKLADQMCMRPGGTLPQKFRSPADLQAFYRLMSCKKVTHATVLAPHREATLAKLNELDGDILILHDATEMDYTSHRSLKRLGQIGSGSGRGYIAQNSLAVDAATREPLGLVNQILHKRPKVPKSETAAQRRKRASRESRLWIKGVQPLPGDRRIVDVCDRGADTFEFIEHEVRSGRRFVIRAYHNRRIFTGHDDETSDEAKLRDYARTLPQQGSWTLQVSSKVETRRGRGKKKKKTVKRTSRQANMAVSFAAVRIRPSDGTCGKSNRHLKVWIVRVWEIDPPKGQERLEWVLITNEPVRSFKAAYRVVSWYESRWIIEEYHKGMKTGCRIESLQFTSEQRLKPAIALVSIVTLTLLQLRDASRRPDAKTRKASTIVCPKYVEMLSLWRHKKVKPDWTVHEFYYALARLGGHQNRKHDHPPGWQVLWEGWKELLPMVIGYDTAKSKYQKRRCDKT